MERPTAAVAGSPGVSSTSPSPSRAPPSKASRHSSSSSLSLAVSHRWHDVLIALSSLSPLPGSVSFTLSLYRQLEQLKYIPSAPPPSLLPALLPLLHRLLGHPPPSSYLDLEQWRLTLCVALQFLQSLSDRGWLDGDDAVNPVMSFLVAVMERERRKDVGEEKREEGGPSWVLVDALRAASHLLDASHPTAAAFHDRLLPLLLPSLNSSMTVTTPLFPPSEPSSPVSALSSSSSSSSANVRHEERRLAVICVGVLASEVSGELALSLLTCLLQVVEEHVREERYTATTAPATTASSSSSVLLSSLSAVHRVLSSLLTTKQRAQSNIDVPRLLSCVHRLLVRGMPLVLSNGHMQTSVDGSQAKDVERGVTVASGASIASPHTFSPFALPSLFSIPVTSGVTGRSSSSLSFASSSPPSGLPSAAAPTAGNTAAGRAKASSSDEQIRLSAISCLALLATHLLRAFHAHWSAFLPPDVSSSLSPRPFSGHHLITVILYDPSPAIRTSAASLLALLLVNSPLSKSLGPGPIRGSSTAGSLASRNAEVVSAVHVGLLEAVKRETNGDAQVAVVKAIAALAANTPYEQQPGLLLPLVTQLVDVLLPAAASAIRATSRPSSRMPSVPPSPSSSSSLSSVSPSPSSLELKPAVCAALAAVFDRSLPELDHFLTGKPTFVSSLIAMAAARVPSDLPIDAWLPLSKLARHYSAHLLPFWRYGQPASSSISSLLIIALFAQHDAAGRSSALRLLEEWTRTEASELRGGGEEEDDSGGVNEPADARLWEMDGVNELYGHHLPVLYREGGGSGGGVRAKVVALLGYVPYAMWRRLGGAEPGQQLLAVVQAAAKDEAAAVRLASCQCISLYAVYAARGGGAFVEEAVALLTDLLAPREGVVAVRTRAAWAIANLCESTAAPPTPPPSWSAHVSSSALHALLAAVVDGCEGNEKIVAHTVRAVGNVGRWWLIGDEQEVTWQRLVDAAVHVLSHGKSGKVRWNAAYAAGNLLRNASLSTSAAEPTAAALLPALLLVLEQRLSTAACSSSAAVSFKASINAAMALSCPSPRAGFGRLYVDVLRALLTAVPACEALSLNDWREVNYRETLHCHLVLALLHVLSMLSEDGEDAEVLAAVTTGLSVIARIVLRERLRVDGEASRARLSSMTKRATAAVTGRAVSTPPSSASLLRPSAELLDLVLQRVSRLLPDAEARAQLLADADGVSLDTSH